MTLKWLGYNIVNSTVAIILMFMYLQAWYLGVRCKSNPEQDKRVKKLIEKSWKDLGKMSQEEILVLIAFVILVLSWFFREPGFMKGKNSYLIRRILHTVYQNLEIFCKIHYEFPY